MRSMSLAVKQLSGCQPAPAVTRQMTYCVPHIPHLLTLILSGPADTKQNEAVGTQTD